MLNILLKNKKFKVEFLYRSRACFSSKDTKTIIQSTTLNYGDILYAQTSATTLKPLDVSTTDLDLNEISRMNQS